MDREIRRFGATDAGGTPYTILVLQRSASAPPEPYDWVRPPWYLRTPEGEIVNFRGRNTYEILRPDPLRLTSEDPGAY